MNIVGHLLIAASVRKDVLRQTGCRLSRIGFLSGNILPDLSARYGENPHFYQDSFPFVLDSTRRLLRDLDGGRLSPFSCSLRAGVITHYLSDFFCYAHSAHCSFDMYEHHLYECRMMGQFRSGLLRFKEREADALLGEPSLELLIRGQEEAYGKALTGGTTDFYFALTVSSQVVRRLVANPRSRPAGRPFGSKPVVCLSKGEG